MFEQLGMGLPDAKSRCASYLAEDPSDAAKREVLLDRKNRLLKALETVSMFGF